MISLLWSTGLRRSELAALRVDDLDLDAMTVLVRTSKTGRPRRVPYDQRTHQHLLRYLARRGSYPVDCGDALWVDKRGPLSSDGIRQVIERLRRKAGLDISAHAFRRGWAAHSMGKLGVSQTSVMTAAGWTTPTMPGRYLRGVREEVVTDEFRRAWGQHVQ